MAWSSPMTAVSGAVYTAAQFNTSVRDNLNETAVAIATSAANGGYFVSTGDNSLSQRSPEHDLVGTSENTTSTNYTDLTTNGPAVTVDTGTAALVFLSVRTSNSSSSAGLMAVNITGASTISPNDNKATLHADQDGSSSIVCQSYLENGLTAGSNTFTCQYKVFNNTGTFSIRRITVLPL